MQSRLRWRRPARPGITARCVEQISRGTREECAAVLAGMPGALPGADGITRHAVLERAESLPYLEELYVACPAVVEPKAWPGFESWWAEASSCDVLF